MEKSLRKLLEKGVSLEEMHTLSKEFGFSYEVTRNRGFNNNGFEYKIKFYFGKIKKSSFIKDIDESMFEDTISFDDEPSEEHPILLLKGARKMNEQLVLLHDEKEGEKAFDRVKAYIKENRAKIILKSFENAKTNDKNLRFFEFENYKPIEKNVKQTKNAKLVEFKKIKSGITKSGIEYVFCSSDGKGVLIEKTVLNQLGLKYNADSYSILANQFFLDKTDKKRVFRLKLKVPLADWKILVDLKEILLKGLDWKTLSTIAKEMEFIVSEITHPEYGRFIAIRPDECYKIDNRHRLNFYPGKSILNSGIEEDSLLAYIEKNEKRLMFRTFEKGEGFYHRFYLRKVSNSFKKIDSTNSTANDADLDWI